MTYRDRHSYCVIEGSKEKGWVYNVYSNTNSLIQKCEPQSSRYWVKKTGKKVSAEYSRKVQEDLDKKAAIA